RAAERPYGVSLSSQPGPHLGRAPGGLSRKSSGYQAVRKGSPLATAEAHLDLEAAEVTEPKLDLVSGDISTGDASIIVDLALDSHADVAAGRRAKIICTIGPASNSAYAIRDLLRLGMVVARLNFLLVTQADHVRNIYRL